jgi:hypothetical protein
MHLKHVGAPPVPPVPVVDAAPPWPPSPVEEEAPPPPSPVVEEEEEAPAVTVVGVESGRSPPGACAAKTEARLMKRSSVLTRVQLEAAHAASRTARWGERIGGGYARRRGRQSRQNFDAARVRR